MATEGVPISAPRPLPKPERAIAPEATGTDFSTQTANRPAVRESLHAPCLRELVRHSELAPQLSLGGKQLKKVLTLESEIQYHGGRFQIDKDFAR